MFAPSPGAAVRAAPSALAIHLGDTRATLTRLLGPCEAAPGADGVCVYWQRGLELELSSGRVQRMVAHQAGDASLLADGAAKGRFGLFRQSIGQVQIGMSAAALLNLLGPPDQRLLPLGNNPGPDAGVWEYPKRGLAVEVEPVAGKPQVVRIHVPLAPGRPAR